MLTMAAAEGRCLAQCIAAYERHGGNIIAVEEVPPEETHHYGVVSIGKDFGHTFEITGMVEKPPKGTAPSTLMISGRYVLGPEIFAILEKGEIGAGGEIQLTDAMKALTRAKLFTACASMARPTIAGRSLAFSPPMWPSRSPMRT